MRTEIEDYGCHYQHSVVTEVRIGKVMSARAVGGISGRKANKLPVGTKEAKDTKASKVSTTGTSRGCTVVETTSESGTVATSRAEDGVSGKGNSN